MTGLTYNDYLRLSGLLGQQVPRSSPPAHDEMLFITVHQVYELWFKLLLHELTDAKDAMLANRPYVSRARMDRCHAVERQLIGAVDVIDTMAPQDFLAFRAQLSGASGLQSAQFREIEFLSGAKDPAYLRRHRALTEVERGRLARRLAEPSLWDGYLHVLACAGFDVSTPPARRDTFRTLAQHREDHGQLWDLGNALVTHDQNFRIWRGRHVVMVERQIGGRPGTGGSTGADYLRSRRDLCFYPELWGVG